RAEIAAHELADAAGSDEQVEVKPTRSRPDDSEICALAADQLSDDGHGMPAVDEAAERYRHAIAHEVGGLRNRGQLLLPRDCRRHARAPCPMRRRYGQRGSGLSLCTRRVPTPEDVSSALVTIPVSRSMTRTS